MTLNRMYHCVPRIISGLSQMSGFSCQRHDAVHGEREQQVRRERREELRDRLHDLRRRAAAVPTQTPTGTQIRLASAISTNTRTSVSEREAERRAAPRAATSCSNSTRSDVPQRQSSSASDRRANHSTIAHGSRLRRSARGCVGEPSGIAQLVQRTPASNAAWRRETSRERRIMRRAPRSAAAAARLLLEAQSVDPRDERPEQQLVVEQDHDEHRDDRPADRAADRRARSPPRCTSRCPAARRACCRR